MPNQHFPVMYIQLPLFFPPEPQRTRVILFLSNPSESFEQHEHSKLLLHVEHSPVPQSFLILNYFEVFYHSVFLIRTGAVCKYAIKNMAPRSTHGTIESMA